MAVDPLQPAEVTRATWEARAVWQASCLSVNGGARPRDITGMCVLSIICHRLAIEEMQFLLRACGFYGTTKPMLTTAAKVAKTGHVMADMVTSDDVIYKNQALFRSKKQMESAFRHFADLIELTDAERIEFFEAINNWIVCDYRIDPTMNAADPDAKRLVVH